MEIEIVKLDNLGRGIGYINNKIIFVPKCLPNDIVRVKIEKEKSKYYEGKLVEIIKPSKYRVNPVCPYFNRCGGCDLQHLSISDSLEYKLNKINDLLKINQINYQVNKIIKSEEQYNYRNKITLKVVNKQIGFYESNTHTLIEIDYCYLVKEEINNLLKDLYLLNIINGTITIRSNYNKELLIIIDSIDKIDNIDKLIINHKIIGIVLNNKTIYGDNYFIDKINDYLFKVSYDAFFQVNPFICSNLFNLINESTYDSSNILDLYCGVGTLSLAVNSNSIKVRGIEIVENAVKNASFNASLNKIDNVSFICADTKNVIDEIKNDYDTVILDPPRIGVNKKVIDKIKEQKIKKIIYISCNEITLMRDLKLLLTDYKIVDLELLDMFANTEHVECFCVLNLR